MLNFQNAEIVSLQIANDFFGDVFAYKQTQTVSIEGSVVNYSNLSGISGTWNQFAPFLSGDNDLSNIIVNDWSFGRGRVESLTFNGEDDAREKRYSATFIVDASGFYSDMSASPYYSGVNYDLFKNIQDLSESISYNRPNRFEESYERSINLQLSQNFSGQNTIGLSKAIAHNLFGHLNLSGFLGSYTQLSDYRKIRSETYDVISKNCSFNEKIIKPTGTADWIVERSLGATTNENGITQATESAIIRVVKLPFLSRTAAAINAEINGSLGRCQALITAYYPDAATLKTDPISTTKAQNLFNGECGYEISYTNDPKWANLYSWEYALTFDEDQNGTKSCSEQGGVVGIGRPLLDKYPNALSGYYVVISGAPSRIQNFYSSQGGSKPTSQIARSFSRSQFKGTINYSLEYNDQDFGGAGNVSYYENSISDAKRNKLLIEYNIFNEKEIVQDQRNLTEGRLGQRISVEGNRNLTLSEALTFAKTKLIAASGVNVMRNASYEYNPVENSLSLNVEKEYF